MGVINLGLSAEYHGSRVTVDVSHLMIDLVWKFANATPPGNPSQHDTIFDVRATNLDSKSYKNLPVPSSSTKSGKSSLL